MILSIIPLRGISQLLYIPQILPNKCFARIYIAFTLVYDRCRIENKIYTSLSECLFEINGRPLHSMGGQINIFKSSFSNQRQETMTDHYYRLQVLIPKIEYRGHHPNRAVISGIQFTTKYSRDPSRIEREKNSSYH